MRAEKRSADEKMTAERRETKYIVEPKSARGLVAKCSARLPRHRFRETEEKASHYVTTVYFDTPRRDLYRAAVASESNLKLRAKEYYDLRRELVETATDLRNAVHFIRTLWLEIKHKDGTRTGKRRVGIPKHDVPAFFGQGTVTPEMMRIQERVFGAEAEQVLREVRELCGRFSEPLRADCLVNYRRLAWQDDSGTLRLTLDEGIRFYSPPEDLWQRKYALLRETLGDAKGSQQSYVLEVKSRGPQPPWLVELLSAPGVARKAFSKFEAASRAVHG